MTGQFPQRRESDVAQDVRAERIALKNAAAQKRPPRRRSRRRRGQETMATSIKTRRR